MKTIFILMDSLNRHYLNAYEYSWVNTPNIDRLAAKGVVFDNHYSGSLPCVPARREIMTGRLNFLESQWCPLQPFDETYPEELRRQSNVYSHLITDHYHYFEKKGWGYHTPFNTWEFLRGQEGDNWHPRVKDPYTPKFRGKNRRQDWVNRSIMNSEQDEDYPTPQCFKQAINFIESNHKEDNWHLHLEVFDPHEPFMCPTRYRELYNDSWADPYHFDWPSYAPVDSDLEGKEAIEHIRKCYAGTLTMTDAWLGKFLDKMDELDMWHDTAVILTTDHGYLLGDYGYWAKNYMFDYQKLVNIPMIAYIPDSPMNGNRVSGLTSTMDLMPTLLHLHGAKPSEHVHGKSFTHLFERDESHHDAVLYGYFGKDINLADGRFSYCRKPVPESIAYHYTAIPVVGGNKLQDYEECEVDRFLPQTKMPVFRIANKSHQHHNATKEHLLYNIVDDTEQAVPIHDSKLHQQYEKKLQEMLKRYQAPDWQYARVGLSSGESK
ncbi:sulfatase-like hydrolase/transferase [Gracilibacillus salitolerans]|uniref:Sulfatase-like hydrolase/transferase n=1 Tax=Gracilibacillus salitolerans TaxID=2663022 RepID=A0A5Q2TS45_9BACI|nr:sulfatase [Gracilibacillus salitolerans]QGH36942.1 sulfatase-like hydrolase/transferase [Gracilibacillus salitolerans]